MKFHERLKSLRCSKNITQGELAKMTGLSRSAVSMYESGKRRPDYETLEMLADFFNVNMDYLRQIRSIPAFFQCLSLAWSILSMFPYLLYAR